MEEIKPVLSFGFDIDLFEEEVKMKGYCSDLVVTLPDSTKYEVCFYDPVRLMQDVADEGYVAMVGLIVIQEVTKTYTEEAVYKLWRNGFFSHLIPAEI